MRDQRDIPPNVYRSMLRKNYQQSHRDYERIKNSFNNNCNPICQKEDRFIPPKTKGNILTQEYIRKMAEKPEKPHIKRIPIQSNLSSGVKVITETKPTRGIRIGPEYRYHPYSAERRRCRKKILPQSKANFYFDAFNCAKENQLDLIQLRNKVSII